MSEIDVKRTTEEHFREYSETKSLELRNEIVKENLYLAEIIAHKYAGRGIEYEDLYQVASYALVLAVTRFDPKRNVQFTSFATPTIIGEIKKHFSNRWSLSVPRRLKENSLKVISANEQLQKKNSRIPTVQEIAEYLAISEEDVLEALESSKAYTTYSLDQGYDNDDGESQEYRKYLSEEEKGYERFETFDVLEKVIKDLTQREKEIIRKRFLLEISQSEVAKELGVSQMTISRIERAMIRKFHKENHIN